LIGRLGLSTAGENQFSKTSQRLSGGRQPEAANQEITHSNWNAYGIRLYVESRCILGGAPKIFKALNALSPTPGASARMRRDERDEGRELARLTHAPARVLARARDTRKLGSQTRQMLN